MIKVTYTSRFRAPLISYYDFAHNAKTILLLAGYLPLQDDDDTYVNLYTHETAQLTRI